MAFLGLRLSAWHKVLLESCTHLGQPAALMAQLGGDAAGLAAVAFVEKGALWQLGTNGNVCQRRWPALVVSEAPNDKAAHLRCE